MHPSAQSAQAEAAAPVPPVNAGFITPTRTAEPIIIELKSGAQGKEVLRLQQRLAVLGFFYTAEDGKYGANTQNAIIEFENYLRLLEQDEIDIMLAELEANKTPTPSPTPTPTPSPTFPLFSDASALPDASISPEVTASPTPTPVPTPTPTPVPTPATPADGIADVGIQEILYGDANALYRRDLGMSDKGLDALRIQRRLIRLNYLNDTPDGIIGVNTENAIKAFQQEHDLNQTGIADFTTQELLFSEDVIVADRPVYNQLYLGVTSEDVKELQKQLRLLGFTNRKVSGVYDQQTQTAVMLYETHLHQIEMMEKGIATLSPDATPVPAEILDNQGNIQGDPETNPYEIGEENDLLDASLSSAEPSVQPSANPVNEVSPAQPVGSTTTLIDMFTPTGIMTAEMQERLFEEGVPVYMQTLRRGDTGEQVKRIQRRLYSLAYLTANGVDGIFGKGTEDAIKAFQRRNKLAETGIADLEMQSTIFSEDAIRSIKPYQIQVSTKDQRVYVYTHDDKDEYTILVKEFICSTGLKSTPTPPGTFTNTGPGARWHYFKKFECWAQYAYYIDGDIMFHSVLYDEQDVSTLRKGSVSALGSPASHGCVRLRVEDAEWIYYNCSSGTTVIVY